MDHIIKKHKSKPQSRRYFTKETEQAIVRYNNSSSDAEKSKIYEEYIHWPFYKLTQNIIHTFKFYYTEVNKLEDLQHEIMIFLLSKIHHFDPSTGAKAYSYFGTIVKNWLIVYNKKNYKKKINNISISDLTNYSNIDKSDPKFISSKKMDEEVTSVIKKEEYLDDDELGMQGYKYKDKLYWFVDKYVEYCTKNIYELFPKKRDAQIADAILELFRKREAISMSDFNKKALYIFIREQVDVKTPKITKIAKQLNKIFQEKYSYYLEHGKFPE